MRRSSSTTRILVFNSAMGESLPIVTLAADHDQYHAGMRAPTLLLVISLSASGALAQGKGQPAKPRAQQQQMSQQDRQRMRDDMHEAYRDRSRERPDRQRPMTREERDKLRQDIQDANKQLRR
jgi:hypothetical protein